MANPTYRSPPAPHDIDFIANYMRKADRDEVIAVVGKVDMRALLARCVHASSHCWVASDGEPVAIFGVAPQTPGVGSPWLIGTDALVEPAMQLALVRDVRWYIAQWLTLYPRLENFVDVRNERSVRWLEHVGFKIHAPEKYGIEGHLFHRFEMEAPCALP